MMIVTKNTETLNYINDLFVGIVIEEHLPTKKNELYTVDVILIKNAQIIKNVPVEIGTKDEDCYSWTSLHPAEYIKGVKIQDKSKLTLVDYLNSDGSWVLIQFINSNRHLPIITNIIRNQVNSVNNNIEGESKKLSFPLKDIQDVIYIAGNFIYFLKNGEVIFEHKDSNEISKLSKTLWKIWIKDNMIELYDNTDKKIVEISNGSGTNNLTPTVLFDKLKTILDNIQSVLNNIKSNFNTHTHLITGVQAGSDNITSNVTTSTILSTNIGDTGSINSPNIKITSN